MLMGSYTRSSARSNQALDFNVDNPILSPQQPGPYPWDTPNRFLSWGYLPFFKLPIIHQLEIAYSLEARTGFPFSLFNDQQQLISAPGAERFPDYFSLNLQLEKRFHLFGYYLRPPRRLRQHHRHAAIPTSSTASSTPSPSRAHLHRLPGPRLHLQNPPPRPQINSRSIM